LLLDVVKNAKHRVHVLSAMNINNKEFSHFLFLNHSVARASMQMYTASAARYDAEVTRVN